MQITLENGKQVTIPDEIIRKNMENLELSENDAIELYLSDNDLVESEEQNLLDEKARKIKIVHGAKGESQTTKEKDPRKVQVKVSDEKKRLFDAIYGELTDFCAENDGVVQVITNNKLFKLTIGEKNFKIDIVEQRPPKKTEN